MANESNDVATDVGKSRLIPSTRLSVYVMLFLTTTVQFALRYALNMSIVCMVVPPQQQQQHNNDNNSALDENNTVMDSVNASFVESSSSPCGLSLSKKSDFGYDGEFYWSRPQVGYIIAAFFYAYIPMQVVAGLLADKFGVRHVLGTGMLMGGVLSLLTPVAARLHYGLLIALRLLMGFTLGTVFPCIHSCIGKWVPVSERGTFISCVHIGPACGIMISFLVSGYLCQYSWTIVFYIFGAMTVLWYLTWIYVVYSDPDDHPRITDREKYYIKSSNKATSGVKKRGKIPWRRLLTSRSMLGLCICQVGILWYYHTMNTVPLYMQDVMYFNIKENGLVSSMPILINIFCGAVFGFLYDFVHRTVVRSRFVMRKTSATIFSLGVGILQIALSYMQCDQRTAAILVFCFIYLFACFNRGALTCAPSDVAPRMAGLVFGISNFVGNFAGFLVPIAIGNLTTHGTQSEWQTVFFLSAGFLVVEWLTFLFLVGTDEEPWAKGENVDPVTIDQDGEDTVEVKTNLTNQNQNEKIEI